MSRENRYYHCAATNLTSKAKPGKGKQVTYRAGITYNGGTVIDGEWYAGYAVPPPIIPVGYELVDLGIGLELNSRPPQATALLRHMTPVRVLQRAADTERLQRERSERLTKQREACLDEMAEWATKPEVRQGALGWQARMAGPDGTSWTTHASRAEAEDHLIDVYFAD